MATYTPVYTTAILAKTKAGLTNSEVDMSDADIISLTIEDAEKEVDVLTGRKFTDANARTEYLSVKRTDVIGNSPITIQLSNYPVLSITEFKQVDVNQTAINTFGTLTTANIAAGTYYTTDYWMDTMEDTLTNAIICNGKITMKTVSFPKGTNNIKVAYTYGYTSVPSSVRNLATCLASMRLWTIFLGGSYNRFNDYSIPQQTVSKGDFYQRGKQILETLSLEADKLLERIGRRPRTLFYATGGDR